MCTLARRLLAVTLLLIAAAPGLQSAEPTKKALEPARESKTLDVRPPDARKLFSEAQLQQWANPPLPEYIEEVEVTRRRPSWLGKVAWLFVPYNPTTTNTRVYRVADARQPYLKPVVALPRMAGEPQVYDR